MQRWICDTFATSLGEMFAVFDEDLRLVRLAFGNKASHKQALARLVNSAHSSLERQEGCAGDVARQMHDYLAGQRRVFTAALAPRGTAFQCSVWHALTRIPYGHTCSYQDIAQAVGNPLAARAIGRANHENPISIVIPCHRVIGKNGALVGYGGGLPLKSRLLAHEAMHLHALTLDFGDRAHGAAQCLD